MVEDSKADSAGGGKEKAKVCRIREFLVKWQGKSYWKCSWVTELRVSSAGSILMVTVCCFIIVFFTYTRHAHTQCSFIVGCVSADYPEGVHSQAQHGQGATRGAGPPYPAAVQEAIDCLPR